MSHHLSEDQICRAIAGQSTIVQRRHVAGCDDCRAELDRFQNTLAAFRRSATAWAERQTQQPVFEPRATGKWEWALTAAAAVIVGIAIPMWPTADRSRTSAPVSRHGLSVAGVETEIFPLKYSNVPVTNGQTIRLELPRTALASFGLEADETSGTVLADVLVGQDGLARAVRFVRP
jgi:hypothetical protein